MPNEKRTESTYGVLIHRDTAVEIETMQRKNPTTTLFCRMKRKKTVRCLCAVFFQKDYSDIYS